MLSILENSMVYVLYADYELLYVGQTSRSQGLLMALMRHRRDDLADRWNRFSWFGLRWPTQNGLSALAQRRTVDTPDLLNHIEAILIHSAEPALNRQGGRFGEDVVRFIQVRDERLGPTQEEMIADMWEQTSET